MKESRLLPGVWLELQGGGEKYIKGQIREEQRLERGGLTIFNAAS